MTAVGAHVRNNAISVMRASRWESSERVLRESLRGMAKTKTFVVVPITMSACTEMPYIALNA